MHINTVHLINLFLCDDMFAVAINERQQIYQLLPFKGKQISIVAMAVVFSLLAQHLLFLSQTHITPRQVAGGALAFILN